MKSVFLSLRISGRAYSFHHVRSLFIRELYDSPAVSSESFAFIGKRLEIVSREVIPPWMITKLNYTLKITFTAISKIKATKEISAIDDFEIGGLFFVLSVCSPFGCGM